MGEPTGDGRPGSSEESFGVAIVRAWRSDQRMLIRVIASEGVGADLDHDAAGFATDSVDEAVDHVRKFLGDIENPWHGRD